MDAANLIKPMLARGKLRCIGATTLAEYRQHIEKDAAFERRFQTVQVDEPSVPDAIAILRGLREKYEVHHGVRILDSAVVQAATLAKRYLSNRRLPDSAIDLVDEACANVRVSRETVPEDIDKLERKKLQLEVAVHALEREKDEASKEQLEAARKEIAAIEDELQPLKAAYEAEKARGEELNNVRRRIDELRSKADEAERRYDLSTAADIRYYAIPDLEAKLRKMEAAEREREAAGMENDNAVGPEQIAEIVARWTGIPVSRMLQTERDKLLQMEKLLQKSVVGQPEAVKAVAQAIRLSRSGLSNADRPIASFLFCGPSGTGKTFLAKSLARFLFDSQDAMIRIDASEYSEKHSVSRLVGSPPGYVGHDEGGQLTEYIRRKPYSIVLVDEIEKAAKEFVTLFLQVLDDGRLTDGQGRVVDFKNTVIIMTSNLGASYLNEAGEGAISEPTKQLVNGAISAHFPPEFINRLDSIVIFHKLAREDVRKIVDIRLREVQQRLITNGRKIKIELDDPAKDFLGSVGYHPQYGARPLQRAIQNELLNPLSLLLLRNQVRDGETVKVTFDQHRNILHVVPNHEPPDGMAVDEDEDEEMDEDDELEDGTGIEPID